MLKSAVGRYCRGGLRCGQTQTRTGICSPAFVKTGLLFVVYSVGLAVLSEATTAGRLKAAGRLDSRTKQRISAASVEATFVEGSCARSHKLLIRNSPRERPDGFMEVRLKLLIRLPFEIGSHKS
jgi:hypothetical protein